ncbi:PilX N-terminal domain-containing pilus assembly protein [Porticoccus sp.]
MKRDFTAMSLSPGRQCGAILLIAIVFLLLLSVLALGTMRSGTLEFLMAGNEQSRVEAYELAAAVNESVISRWKKSTSGGVTIEANFNTDKTLCSTGNPDPDCDGYTLSIDDNLSSTLNDTNATVEYATHYLAEGRAPRGAGQEEDDCAFYFETEADFDNSANSQGVSHQAEGVYIVNPVAQDCIQVSGADQKGDLDKYAHIPTVSVP